MRERLEDGCGGIMSSLYCFPHHLTLSYPYKVGTYFASCKL